MINAKSNCTYVDVVVVLLIMTRRFFFGPVFVPIADWISGKWFSCRGQGAEITSPQKSGLVRLSSWLCLSKYYSCMSSDEGSPFCGPSLSEKFNLQRCFVLDFWLAPSVRSHSFLLSIWNINERAHCRSLFFIIMKILMITVYSKRDRQRGTIICSWDPEVDYVSNSFVWSVEVRICFRLNCGPLWFQS